MVRAGAAHYAHEIERYFGWREVFVAAALLPLLGFLGMGLSGGVIGVLFGLAFPLSRGVCLVVFYDALNKRLDADFRATLNSLVSLGIRGIFIVTGPLLGYLADTRGINTSLLVLACAFLPAAALVLIPLARRIRFEETVREKPVVPGEVEI